MNVNKKQNNTKETNLYNNILLLSRNKIFYTKFHLIDSFQNRIHLIFILFSFIFIKGKFNNEKYNQKPFFQSLFDLLFKRIELNMREIGYGDVLVNKNMKFLVKIFYSILLDCEKYKKNTPELKNIFFAKYLKFKPSTKVANNQLLLNYFDKYEAFCFDLSFNSVLKGELKFNYY